MATLEGPDLGVGLPQRRGDVPLLVQGACFQVVADPLPLPQVTVTSILDRADVDEHLTRAIVGLDEPITLGRIEPLDRAGGHAQLPFMASSTTPTWEGRTRRQRDRRP